jgi:hypothetical protein
LIEVELLYLDVENSFRESKTLPIESRNERFRWDISLRDPSKRQYEYRVTGHKLAGGPPDVGPWTRTGERILVIPVARRN